MTTGTIAMTTKEKPFFSSQNIFISHKRHVTNQAPVYFFEDDTLKEIKRIGLTSEMMEKIAANVHIFIYETQVTIHGIISQEQMKLIEIVQGYKSCTRNDNGTLGIKYSVIDIEKKEKLNNTLISIRELLKIPVPKLHHDSQGTVFHIGFKEKESRDEMYNKIDLSLFHGRKSVYSGSFKEHREYTHRLKIDIGLLKEDMIWPIINNWIGITYEKYQEAIELRKKAQEAYQEKLAQEREQLNQLGVQKEKKRQENYEASLKALAHLPRWDGKVDKDMILVSGTRTIPDTGFEFVWLSKNPWDWRYERHASHDNKESLPGAMSYFHRFGAPGSRDHFLSEGQWHVWEEKVKPVPKPQPKVQELELRPYKKALALFGNTLPHEKLLEKLGGKKNNSLIHPVTGIKTPGWIFFKNQEWILKKTFNIEITPVTIAA